MSFVRHLQETEPSMHNVWLSTECAGSQPEPLEQAQRESVAAFSWSKPLYTDVTHGQTYCLENQILQDERAASSAKKTTLEKHDRAHLSLIISRMQSTA